jgi:hypothetical protein
MRSIIDQRNKPYKFRGRSVENKKVGFGIKVWDDNAYLKGYWDDNYLKGFAYFKNKDSNIFMGKIFINKANLKRIEQMDSEYIQIMKVHNMFQNG